MESRIHGSFKGKTSSLGSSSFKKLLTFGDPIKYVRHKRDISIVRIANKGLERMLSAPNMADSANRNTAVKNAQSLALPKPKATANIMMETMMETIPPYTSGLGTSNLTPITLRNGFKGASGKSSKPDNPVASKMADIAKRREFIAEIPSGTFFIFP